MPHIYPTPDAEGLAKTKEYYLAEFGRKVRPNLRGIALSFWHTLVHKHNVFGKFYLFSDG